MNSRAVLRTAERIVGAVKTQTTEVTAAAAKLDEKVGSLMVNGRVNRKRPASEAALALGPVPTSRLGRELPDEPTLLNAYRQHLALLENRTQPTVDTYLTHVRNFCRYLAENHPSIALSGVTAFHLRSFLLHEATRGIAPPTRSTALFSLRSFYRFLIAEDLCRTNPAKAVILPSPIRGRFEFYSDDEADAIIAFASAQDARRWQVGQVLLCTLRHSGLRLAELVNLRSDEVDLDARRISIVGKGRKPRVVPYPHLLADVLCAYLDELRPLLVPSPYLFVNPNGERNCTLAGRFGPRAVHHLVAQAGDCAGVSGRHFAHRWRHTYATNLVRKGVDIHVIQRLMGHSNITTTTRYLHLSDADLLAAIDRAYGGD